MVIDGIKIGEHAPYFGAVLLVYEILWCLDQAFTCAAFCRLPLNAKGSLRCSRQAYLDR